MESAVQAFPSTQTDQANKTLVGKIVAAMSEISLVPKKGFNQHSGYKYAGIEEIVMACRAPLAKHGLVLFGSLKDITTEVVPSAQGKSLHWTRLTLRFSITDGESAISWDVSGEGMDQGDKSSAKAWTAASKYALKSMLLLPIGDDAEVDSPEAASSVSFKSQPPLVLPPPPAHRPASEVLMATERQLKALGIMARSSGYTEAQLAEQVLQPRFQVKALTDLTRRQASELLDLLKGRQAGA
jgi:hypothetical protein